MLSLRADRNSGDDRDFVPAPLPMTLKGSAALGCPSSGHQGSQQKSPIHRRRLDGRPAAQRCTLPAKATPSASSVQCPAHRAPGREFRAFEGTPVQAMHQPTDMIAMVIHPKFPPDDGSGDSCRGPQLRAVTMRLRLRLRPAASANAGAGWRPTSAGVRAKSAPARRPAPHDAARGTPSQDGTRGALNTSPHLIQRQARVPQGQSSSTTVLKQISTPLQSGHRSSLLKDIILHYLCRDQ